MKLYKYRRVNAFTEALIVRNELFFPDANQLNDPYDCAVKIDFSNGTPEQYRNLIRTVLPQMLGGLVLSEAKIEEVVERHFKEQMLDPFKFSQDLQAGCVASIRKTYGIFCLSETCENVQMWSHYSDGHRGICIEMDAPEILNSAHQVQYVDALSSINFFDQPFESLSQQTMLTKQREWAYEREWRIISQAFPPGLHRLSRSIVTGIILGTKISAGDRERVLAWTLFAKLEAPLYQAYRVPGGTRMEIRALGIAGGRG